MSVTVCVAGDVMLDLLVTAQTGLVPDDDVPASVTVGPGGQAANVAAWVAHLGGAARLFGPRCTDPVGDLLDRQLADRGVRLAAPRVGDRSGAVLSLTAGGVRTMASDPGDLAWVGPALADPAWLSGADWLHLSGYLLLRAADPGPVLAAARAAHAAGAGVSLDLTSAAMVAAFGPGLFAALVQDLEPQLVFGTEGEWDVLRVTGSWTAVVKRGAAGFAVVASGVEREYAAVPGPVLDVTGAGDALAAGFLVGGPALAARAAAACVAILGAQPVRP
ncbi:MAG TPA: carbohydrate kinase family protein [Dermatophilaceae bacterium]|nr:carbohydrate kinase family protein [Dermatophilaceae bacterium]